MKKAQELLVSPDFPKSSKWTVERNATEKTTERKTKVWSKRAAVARLSLTRHRALGSWAQLRVALRREYPKRALQSARQLAMDSSSKSRS